LYEIDAPVTFLPPVLSVFLGEATSVTRLPLFLEPMPPLGSVFWLEAVLTVGLLPACQSNTVQFHEESILLVVSSIFMLKYEI
jgi:hypothetical protein